MLPGMNGFSLCETIRRTDQQLAHTKGCGHVIVGTEGQAPDLVLRLPLGAEDDDADLLVGAADRFAERKTVHARQHHIRCV